MPNIAKTHVRRTYIVGNNRANRGSIVMVPRTCLIVVLGDRIYLVSYHEEKFSIEIVKSY